MLFRLAFSSFRRQVRSYLIYFLSMILAVVIFYTFSALTYDDAILIRANQDAGLSQVLVFGQIAVIGILLFFMLSANRFFLRRRSEEIGIYQLFGLKRWRIISLFTSEIIILGILSLGIGVGIGILLSKLFSLILVKAMALSIESSFFISWRSVGLTASTMFFILLIVAIRTAWILYDYTVNRLFKIEELESSKLQLKWWQKLLGASSIIFLSLSYFLAVKTIALGRLIAHWIEATGFFANFIGMLLIFLLGGIGTILFFIWGLKWLLSLFSRSRKITERNLNSLLIGNLKARLTRNRRTTAGITVTVSLAMILISLAFSTFMISLREVYYADPTDFQIAAEEYPRLREIIEKDGGTVTDDENLNFKTAGAYVISSMANEPPVETVQLVDLISLSNYQDYQRLNKGLPDIHLTKDNQVVLLDNLQNLFRSIITYDSIVVDDTKVAIKQTIADHLGLSELRYGLIVLVVSDELFEKTSGYSYQLRVFNSDNSDLEKLAQDVSDNLVPHYDYSLSYDLWWNGSGVSGEIMSGESGPMVQQRLNYSSQYPNWRFARRQSGLVMYVAVFIGLISLITTGSTISLRQIAEGETSKKNYALLQLLGIPRGKILQLIYLENALVFLPITLVTVLNAFFGIYLLSRYLTFTNFWLPNIFLVLTAAIYFIFYLITVSFYRRVVDI